MATPRVGALSSRLPAALCHSLAANHVSALLLPHAHAHNLYEDMCFDWGAKQVDIYNRTARDIVDACLEGYNGASNMCTHATHDGRSTTPPAAATRHRPPAAKPPTATTRHRVTYNLPH